MRYWLVLFSLFYGSFLFAQNESQMTVEQIENMGAGKMMVGTDGYNEIVDVPNIIIINQPTESLVAGDAIYFHESSGTWRRANTASEETAHQAFVQKVLGVSSFELVPSGIIRRNAHNLVSGQDYYLNEKGEIETDPAYWIKSKVYSVIDANNFIAHPANIEYQNQYSSNSFVSDSLQIDVVNETVVIVNLTMTDASGYTVVWGDGSEDVGMSGVNLSHTYSTSYSGKVNIKNLDRLEVERIVLSGAFQLDFQYLQNYFPMSAHFEMDTGRGKVYGNLAKLSHRVTTIDCQAGELHGDITDYVSEKMVKIRLVGKHRVALDVNDLPADLEYIGVVNQGLISNYFYGRFLNFPIGIDHLDIKDAASVNKHDLYVDFADLANNMPNVLNLNLSKSDFYYSNTTINYVGNPRTFISVADEGRHLTTQEVDDLLEDLAQFSTWDNPKSLFLTGHDAPSAAGNASIAILQGNGVNVVLSSNN